VKVTTLKMYESESKRVKMCNILHMNKALTLEIFVNQSPDRSGDSNLDQIIYEAYYSRLPIGMALEFLMSNMIKDKYWAGPL
jgi:hypothetical protein